LERGEGDPSILVASSDKAKKILGWNPIRTNINKIIEDAWRWHKNNENRYKNDDNLIDMQYKGW